MWTQERRLTFERRLADEIKSLREDFSSRSKTLLSQVELAIARVRLANGGRRRRRRCTWRSSPHPFPSSWEQQRMEALGAMLGGPSRQPNLGRPGTGGAIGGYGGYNALLAAQLGVPGEGAIPAGNGISDSPELASIPSGNGGALDGYLDSALAAVGQALSHAGADQDGPPSGAIEEGKRLSGLAQQEASHNKQSLLEDIQSIGQSVLSQPASVDVDATPPPATGEEGAAVQNKLDPEGSRAELEDKQYMDSLLEDFLNKGADLRHS